jgi:hypothetical protein
LSRDVAAKHETGHARYPEYWGKVIRACLMDRSSAFDLLTIVPAKAGKPKRLEAILESVNPGLTAATQSYPDILRFSDDAEALKGLGLAARNAEARRSLQIARPSDVLGKRVLVVDDVVTTGATFRAASGLLKKAGCRSAQFLAFTRTVNPKQPMVRPCERCGGMMVPRRNRTDGSMFWGCRQFSRGRCNHTVPFSLPDQQSWNDLQA